MPSVNDGRELTGLSRRKVAVEELFLSDRGASGLVEGALNWKNSYSAVMNVRISTANRCVQARRTSSHCTEPLCLELLQGCL